MKTYIYFILLLIFLLSGTPAALSMAQRPPTPPQEIKAPVSQPLTLEESFELALRQSEVISIRTVSIEQTWADFLRASGEFIGDANFQVTHFRQHAQEETSGEGGATGTLTRSERRERKFIIQQPLFQGFRSLGALSAAGSLRKQRIEERRRAEQLLFLDVVRAFHAVLRYQKDIEVSENTIELFKERLQELRQWEEIGKSRPGETSLSLVSLKTLEAEVSQLRGLMKNESRIFEFLTGISLDHYFLKEAGALEQTVAPLSDYVFHAEERPDVEASRQAAKTALRGVIIAQSELWPEISLTNQMYEKREGFQSGIDWDLLFTIDIPLFQGGTALGEVKEALGNWKISKFTLARALRTAELEIKQAYDAYYTSWDQYRAFQEALVASEKNYQIQKDDYARNLVNNLDVLESLESLYLIRRETNRTYYETKVNYWQLQVATGLCCESI